MINKQQEEKVDRRNFLSTGIRWVIFIFLTALAGIKIFKSKEKKYLWQIDPEKCVKCGRCATECVLQQSAVRCVHEYSICGYCNLCFGYFQPGAKKLTEAAENQVCPTGAIDRKFIEEPFFEYTINEPLCIGCAKCVKGCTLFGNGSLYLQVRHDVCVNCNECSIAQACAGNAFMRISSKKQYYRKSKNEDKNV